jgi:hypothetical protein
MAQHDRFNGILNSSRTAKSYFDAGSVRNTAHDEEFFHCFVQYLAEEIKKVKEQAAGDNLDDYDQETKDFDDEMME